MSLLDIESEITIRTENICPSQQLSVTSYKLIPLHIDPETGDVNIDNTPTSGGLPDTISVSNSDGSNFILRVNQEGGGAPTAVVQVPDLLSGDVGVYACLLSLYINLLT